MIQVSYQKALYQRRKKAGLCVDCGENFPKSKYARCESCLAKRRAVHNTRIAMGLCPRCRQPLRDGRAQCPDCLAKGRKRRSKLVNDRRQAGMCIFCGKSQVMPPYTICLPCRIKKRVLEGSHRLGGGSREEVLVRDGKRCRLCGDAKGTRTRSIVIHHIDGSGQAVKCNHSLDNLITLCKACHNHVHMVAKFCTDIDLFLILCERAPISFRPAFGQLIHYRPQFPVLVLPCCLPSMNPG